MSKTTEKYQGKPCRKGHPGVRYRSTHGCVECACDNAKKFQEKRAASLLATATNISRA